MLFKHVDMTSAMRRLADKRIEDAMKEGKFDNLPGKGKPLELEPMPAEENARMTWWMLRILRNNNVTPDEVVWRKALDHLREHLERMTDEKKLIETVSRINELVHKINTLGTNALKSGVAPVSEAEELMRLRARLAGPVHGEGDRS